ncbi:short C-terminal domain containing protein [Synechococcus sp. BMK-MC-1]|nr:short C-terminal domain containing protein [Synechococcus sp. BMK-MC-1]
MRLGSIREASVRKIPFLILSTCTFLLLVNPPVTAKDISIKELNHANIGVPFNKIFPAKEPPNEYVYYDTDYRKQGCAITCDQTDGLLVKWTSFFLQIQPYERYCPFIWYRNRYPSPPESITVTIGDTSHKVNISDRENNVYYLPLAVRSSIPLASGLQISIPGVGLSEYKPNPSALEDIKKVVNPVEELPDQQNPSEKSLEERLSEASTLFESGLISEKEYESMRKAILGIPGQKPGN